MGFGMQVNVLINSHNMPHTKDKNGNTFWKYRLPTTAICKLLKIFKVANTGN